MKIKIQIISLIFGITATCLGQNVNMVIQVNDDLVTFQTSGMYLTFENVKGEIESCQIGYIPGELVLDKNVWKKINSYSNKKIVLSFNYSNFDKKRTWHGNYEIEISKNILDKPYLILNIYDFQNRKYKRWYQYLTDKRFLAELRYPNSGIYVRQE